MVICERYQIIIIQNNSEANANLSYAHSILQASANHCFIKM